MSRSKKYQSIPTRLSGEEFDQFVLPRFTEGSRGPKTKVSFYRLFNYILQLMHTGCQREEIPIEKDPSGKPEIHHTRIFRTFQRWHRDGYFEKIFEGSFSSCFQKKYRIPM